MRGLGRLIALPWLLVALALQGLAPARAQAMPRDAFGLPICSSQDIGSAGHRHDPSRPAGHDCCTAACALVAFDAPPAVVGPEPSQRAATLAQPLHRQADDRRTQSIWRATARAPPPSLLAA